MNWSSRVFGSFESMSASSSSAEAPSLPEKVSALFWQQIETWPQLRAGLANLQKIEARRLRVEGTESDVVIQHNPGRIRSTSAKVDAQSVAERRCFLCPENMPVEEKCIQYGSDLMIACNPFPVLKDHLSIVHRDHIEQKIAGNLDLLLGLARDFGPEFFVLYNGPRSGASAPDHLHFQACSRSLLPIQDDLKRHLNSRPGSNGEVAELSVHLLDDCGRTVIAFASSRPDDLPRTVYETISLLGDGSAHQDKAGRLRNPDGSGHPLEPMMNLIITFDPPRWTVYLFPRAKHRPDSFFAEGDARLTVSPGAIDMAGIVVVPEAEHFKRIDSHTIAAIFREVSLDSAKSRALFSDILKAHAEKEKR